MYLSKRMTGTKCTRVIAPLPCQPTEGSVPNADHGPCAYDDHHGLVLGVHPVGLAVDLHSGKTRTRTRSEPKPVWESLKTGRIPTSIYMEYNSMKRVLKEMIKV